MKLHWSFRKGGGDATDTQSCIAIQVEKRARRWEWFAYAIDSPTKHRLLARSHEDHEVPFALRQQAVASADAWFINWDSDTANSESPKLLRKETFFKCQVCGKVTLGRIPGRGRGDGSYRYPARHKDADGDYCLGSVKEAEWVDLDPITRR